MRPASIVLLISGVGLLLGGALVASLKIPCRFEESPISISNGNPFYRIYKNVWGQPIWAVSNFDDKVLSAHQKPGGWTTEQGPFPNGLRQGKWERVIREPDKPDIASDIWYFDGRVVSAAEWEQRQ